MPGTERVVESGDSQTTQAGGVEGWGAGPGLTGVGGESGSVAGVPVSSLFPPCWLACSAFPGLNPGSTRNEPP